MAITLILPNGEEVTSASTPYVTSEAEAARARDRSAGRAGTAAAQAEAEGMAQQLAANATPQTLARAFGWSDQAVDELMAMAEEERRRQLFDAARRLQGRVLTRDPLVLLARHGSLPGPSLRAGQEIARVFQAIAAGVTPRVTARYAEAMVQGTPQEDWPLALRVAWFRYGAWRDWAGRQPVRVRGSRETLGDLTLLVAGEGHAPKVVAPLLGVSPQTVLRRLQHSLWWYAVNAGWASDVPNICAA